MMGRVFCCRRYYFSKICIEYLLGESMKKFFEKFNSIYTEAVLFMLAGCLIISLIISQFVLARQDGLDHLSKVSKLEGIRVEDYQNNMVHGDVTITVDGTQDFGNIKILQNGETMQTMSENIITVSVRDQGVLEIDGRNCKDPFKVQITSHADNVTLSNEGEIIVINKEISFLSRIMLKNV